MKLDRCNVMDEFDSIFKIKTDFYVHFIDMPYQFPDQINNLLIRMGQLMTLIVR